MELKYVIASELVSYAQKVLDRGAQSIPISLSRAESQVANPSVKPTDTLLIVAEDKGEVLGYIGILPAFYQGNTEERFFYNTCWWASPDAGAGVSFTLLKEFLEYTRMRVAFSDMTPRTFEIICRLGFSTSTRKGIVIRLRTGYHDRSLQKTVKGRYKICIKMIRAAGGFRLLDYLCLLFRKKKYLKFSEPDNSGQFRMEKELPGDEFFTYINKYKQKGFLFPDREIVNWWINKKWLVSPNAKNRQEAVRYHFSLIAGEHEYLFPVLTRDNAIVACGILGIRDGVMKTHYFWVEPDEELDFIDNILRFALEQKKVHTIQSFQAVFVHHVMKMKKFPFRYREVQRYTAMGKLPAEAKFQDGDGDYIFT